VSRPSFLARRSGLLRNIIVGVIAFSVGGATVAQAVGPGGVMGVFRLADRTDDTHLAAVDASGNVAVSVSNFPSTQQVSVSNFPATQQVSVANLPTNQQVTVTNETALVFRKTIAGACCSIWGDTETVDVSAYGTVRISLTFSGQCNGSLQFVVAETENNINFHIDSGSVSCGLTTSRVYEVPGKILTILMSGGPGQTVELAVYGHN